MSAPRKDFNAQVGALVRAARLAADVTQESLADAVALSRTSIVNIEAGSQGTTLVNLVAIAFALDVPVIELIPDERRSVDLHAVSYQRQRLCDLERFTASIIAATNRLGATPK